MNKPNLMYWVDCKNRLSNVKLCLIICKSVLLHEHCHKITWRNISCELILIYWNCGFHDCLTVPFFLLVSLFIKINVLISNKMNWSMNLCQYHLSGVGSGPDGYHIVPTPYYIQQKKPNFLLINMLDLSLQLLPKVTEVHQGSRTNTVMYGEKTIKVYQVDWEWEKWYTPFSPELRTTSQSLHH